MTTSNRNAYEDKTVTLGR